MSAELWGRVARLVAGPLDLSGLAMEFSVSRSLAGKGRAKIALRNLSDNTRGRLESESPLVVELEAGYEGQTSRIFRGAVARPATARSGTDRVTTLEATDGGAAFREARIARSFAAGSSVRDLLAALILDSGLERGNADELLAAVSARMPTGTALCGPAMPLLAGIVRRWGWEVSVQSGALLVTRPDKALTGATAQRLTWSTGLLDAPTIDREGTIALRCLIRPGLEPGLPIVVETEQVRGGYKITEAEWAGSNTAGAWDCKLKGKPL